MKTTIRLFFVTLILAGCTSMVERGDKQYEAGDYNAAAATYERALRFHPNDAQAQENLRKARQKIIEQQLIEVRQLRMSDNYADSQGKLKRLINQENSWQLAPAGAAFSAQSEEMEYFFKWLSEQTARNESAEKYMNAKLLLQENEFVFAKSTFSGSYQRLVSRVDTGGGRHCRKIKSIVGGHFSNEFWQHYCVFWGQTANSNSSKNIPNGFGSVTFKGKINGLPEEVLASFSETLMNGLRSSPLYQADGKALAVELSGIFEKNYVESKNVGIHSYDEDVPYQEMVQVSYQESEPFLNTRVVTDPVTGLNRTETFTDYRSVTKYRQEAVTKYRKEARTLPFVKTDYTADFNLNGAMNFSLDGGTFSIPLSGQYHRVDYYSEISNERIGLHARPFDVPTQANWLKSTIAPVSTNVSQQVKSAWENKYCNFKNSGGKSTQAEGILKCAAGGGKELELVNNWSMEMFNLPYTKVSQVIGL